MSTGRQGLGSTGTTSQALAFGGESTTAVNATEEWTGAGPVTQTITAS